MKIKQRTKKLYRDLRRAYYYTFDKNHIINSIKARNGKCLMCGKCCLGCPHLKEKKCTTYFDRPRWCNKDFPFDRKELELSGREGCGYSWEED